MDTPDGPHDAPREGGGPPADETGGGHAPHSDRGAAPAADGADGGHLPSSSEPAALNGAERGRYEDEDGALVGGGGSFSDEGAAAASGAPLPSGAEEFAAAALRASNDSIAEAARLNAAANFRQRMADNERRRKSDFELSEHRRLDR